MNADESSKCQPGTPDDEKVPDEVDKTILIRADEVPDSRGYSVRPRSQPTEDLDDSLGDIADEVVVLLPPEEIPEGSLIEDHDVPCMQTEALDDFRLDGAGAELTEEMQALDYGHEDGGSYPTEEMSCERPGGGPLSDAALLSSHPSHVATEPVDPYQVEDELLNDLPELNDVEDITALVDVEDAYELEDPNDPMELEFTADAPRRRLSKAVLVPVALVLLIVSWAAVNFFDEYRAYWTKDAAPVTTDTASTVGTDPVAPPDGVTTDDGTGAVTTSNGGVVDQTPTAATPDPVTAENVTETPGIDVAVDPLPTTTPPAGTDFRGWMRESLVSHLNPSMNVDK